MLIMESCCLSCGFSQRSPDGAELAERNPGFSPLSGDLVSHCTSTDKRNRACNQRPDSDSAERGDDLHIISLRKAEKHEIRRYIAEISH